MVKCCKSKANGNSASQGMSMNLFLPQVCNSTGVRGTGANVDVMKTNSLIKHRIINNNYVNNLFEGIDLL